MKFKFLLFLTPLILLSSCSNDEYVEVPIKQRPLYQYEPWYGDEGNPKDSIPFPLVSELELYIENMRNLETNSEEVNFSGLISTYTEITKPYVDFEGDTIWSPEWNFIESNIIVRTNETYYEDDFYTEIISIDRNKELYNADSLYQKIDRFSAFLFHDWDLRKYPFDKQKIEYRLTSFLDTTEHRLAHSKIYPSSFSEKNDLKQGFEIEGIEFREEFIDSPWESELLGRKEVFSQGVFSIIISRTGSWLFVKLFFGGILALVISWLVFIIPLRDFASRIELSIGAVFAAVGNKYFVDSAVDSQVLTVADLFNNIIIFMVVLNVGLIIMKRNAVFKNKLINDTRTVSRISIYTALVLFGLLTIYTIT